MLSTSRLETNPCAGVVVSVRSDSIGIGCDITESQVPGLAKLAIDQERIVITVLMNRAEPLSCQSPSYMQLRLVLTTSPI